MSHIYIYTRNIYIFTYDMKDPYFELQVAPVSGAGKFSRDFGAWEMVFFSLDQET